MGPNIPKPSLPSPPTPPPLPKVELPRVELPKPPGAPHIPGLPGAPHLPSPESISGGLDAARRAGLNRLLGEFNGKALPLFNGFKDVLIQFAERQITELNEHFQKAVELLILCGQNAREIMERALKLVCDGLKKADPSRLSSLWDHANWLIALAIRTNAELVQRFISQVLLATKDQFEQHKNHVEHFLEDDLVELRNRGQDVLSFSRNVLIAVRDGAGDIGSHGKYFVDLTVALVPATAAACKTDFPTVLGSLLGVFVGGLDRSGKDLGLVLEPLVHKLAETRKLTGDEAKLFIHHLGDDALMKKVAQWIHDHWELFARLVKEGLEELKKWIEFIIGLIKQAVDQFKFPEHEKLVSMLQWLQGLPKTVLAPPVLARQITATGERGAAIGGGIQEQLEALKRLAQSGIVPWLHAEASRQGTSMAQFAKEFVTEKNPLVANLKRIEGAVMPILDLMGGKGKDIIEKYTNAVDKLYEFDKKVWDALFAGGLGEGPITALVKAHGLFSEPLEIHGGNISASVPASFPGTVKRGEQFVAGLGVNACPDASFVAFEVQREKLLIPHPCDWRPIKLPRGASALPFNMPPIPLPFPMPWDWSVAICHLPEFHVIDMRYHYPYGDLACFHVADQDGDGFVKRWEVQNVRRAVTDAKTNDFYDFVLDCDGDGKITEDDLQLAIEQQTRYVNGLMYRPTTAPVGFFVSPAPSVWAFTTFTHLTDESIPRQVERRGILMLIDGQFIIPIPNLNYPIRFHYENRYFIDVLRGLEIIPGFAPPTPSVRWDVVLRGGKTGRDWQVYVTSEPMNPVLRTWNIKGSLYLRGVGAGGAGAGAGGSVAAALGGKGAVFLAFSYEMSAPLIEVLMEWQDRLKHIGETKPGDLPVPWKFFQGIIEWTEIPSLCRAMIQISGPLTDLIFDWCDEGHHIRGVLGYIRQYVLNHFEPAPSWEQLRKQISDWSDLPPAERDAIAGAVRAVQAEIGAGDEDAVYVPWLLARRARQAIAKPAAAGAPESRKAEPAPAPPDAAPGGHAPGPVQPPQQPPPSPAEARIKTVFEDGRGRFAASLDQLVPTGPPDPKDPDREPTPYDRSASIPLCGELKVLTQYIAGFPVKYDELKKADANEATLDEILAVRGNPFYKPIYHTIVEFGPDARLYTAPAQHGDFLIEPVGAGVKGLVEGSRVLEDEHGNRWLWVRTDSWRHGWLFVDAVVCKEIFSLQEAAKVAGQDLAQSLLQEALGTVAGLGLPVDVLDTDKVNRGLDDLKQKLGLKKARPTITRIEASARHTVDESRHARVCRAALARQAARGADALTKQDRKLIALYENALIEFKLRMFGVAAVALEDGKTEKPENLPNEKLAAAFNRLSVAKREKLWAAGSAWFKLHQYIPIIIEEFVEKLVPPVLKHDFPSAWALVLDMLRKTAKFDLEELVYVAQTCAPAIKDLVLSLIDVAVKLKSIKDMVTTGEGSVAGAGEVGPANQQGQVTWKDVGLKLLRLFVDDEDEPGRPPPAPKAKRRGLRQDHDHGIGFSFEASVKLEKEEEEKKPTTPPNERLIYLAEPQVGRFMIDVPEDEPLPETPFDLYVSSWAALVYTDPPRVVLDIDSARIADEVKAGVRWQVSDDGGGTWTEIGRGERIAFDPAAVEYAGAALTFRAFIGDAPSETGEGDDGAAG